MPPKDPHEAPLDEARRLSELADRVGARARLLGGAAVALSTSEPLPQPLQRVYKDLDYVIPRADAAKWRGLIESNGYEPDSTFNSLHGAHRLLHYDMANERQLDTFVSKFAMCHSIDLEKRLPDTGATLAPEDILLTKLQIFEVNDKDLVDAIALLLVHPIVTGSPSHGINRDRFMNVVGSDWGWHTTISDNISKVAQRLETIGLDNAQLETVRDRIASVMDALDKAPKSLKWRSRAVVGRKLPWYDLPEEVY